MDIFLPVICGECPCPCLRLKDTSRQPLKLSPAIRLKCKARLFDYFLEKSKPAPGLKERATHIAFLKSRLQSESGDDAKETQKEIDYYESGEDLPKPIMP